MVLLNILVINYLCPVMMFSQANEWKRNCQVEEFLCYASAHFQHQSLRGGGAGSLRGLSTHTSQMVSYKLVQEFGGQLVFTFVCFCNSLLETWTFFLFNSYLILLICHLYLVTLERKKDLFNDKQQQLGSIRSYGLLFCITINHSYYAGSVNIFFL